MTEDKAALVCVDPIFNDYDVSVLNVGRSTDYCRHIIHAQHIVNANDLTQHTAEHRVSREPGCSYPLYHAYRQVAAKIRYNRNLPPHTPRPTNEADELSRVLENLL